MSAIVAALLGLAVAFGAARAPVGAWEQSGERIVDYRFTAEVGTDGVASVTERITYDFGGTARHGIERFLQVRYALQASDPVLADKDQGRRWERVTPLSDVRVTSPTGAPSEVKVEHQGSIERIRVGDPDKTVVGVQTYVLSYRLAGVVNAFDGYEEVPLNIVGDQWRVPIASATAAVTLPAAVTDARCVSGGYGSTNPCGNVGTDARTTTVKLANLGAYQGATLYQKVPAGTFENTAPILDEVWSPASAFSLNPATGGLSALLAAALLAAVGALGYRVGRDRQFVGSAVDASFGNASGEERRVGLGRTDGVTVEFVPPDRITPGEAGTLIDERADNIDVTATLVDLAVRGHLNIEDLGDGDYRLNRLDGVTDALDTYEERLVDGLFATGSTVELSELKYTFAAELAEVKRLLYSQLVDNGWYRKSPQRIRSRWMGIGVFALLAALAVWVLLVIFTHWALLGVPLVLAALALIVVSYTMPARTGKGTAMYRRVVGFREMFVMGEGDRQRWAAEQNLFSRYLPYAMVFGMTERWAATFEQLAAEGAVPQETMGWWVSPSPFNLMMFSRSMGRFGSTAAGSMSAIQRSSAGSSGGFSGFGGGGFSGGGFGGGGGGSW